VAKQGPFAGVPASSVLFGLPRSEVETTATPIDLVSALRLANAGNPTIALARERIQEAAARLRQAEVLWLPNLQGGPTYLRHDGQIQNATGFVFNTNKQAFSILGGADLSVNPAEAIFGRLIARRLLDATRASAQAVTQDLQLEVASTYLDLLRVYGMLAINADTLSKAEEMLHAAEAASRRGLGKTGADPNRARTERDLRKQERIDLEGQAATVSARLAQLLLLEPTVDLRPVESAVLPITLVPDDAPLEELIATGLLNRPELAESRALVAAAITRWRQARVGPFIPRLDVSYFAGDFGGGINSQMSHFDGRGDALVQATWTLRNFGLGDRAEAQARRSQYRQASLHIVEVQAQVGAEVTAAAKQARAHLRTWQTSEEAVHQAEEMWRKLRKLAFMVGMPAPQYDPIEPLLAEQALDQARKQYLTEVIEYNRAQFRLYTAMGRPPLEALQKIDCPGAPK
jgi:outer membrane protein TolC